MRKRDDVLGMVDGLEFGLRYAWIANQIPYLSHWLMGNIWFAEFLVTQLSYSAAVFHDQNVPDMTVQFRQEWSAEKRDVRLYFSPCLKSEEAKVKLISNGDMMDYLGNSVRQLPLPSPSTSRA